MSKYGVKVKKFSAGALYEYNLGVRQTLSYTRAMMTNSLFLYYLQDNGLKVSKNGSTRDIISISFDFGSKSFEESSGKIEKSIKFEKENTNFDTDRIERLESVYEFMCDSQDKFIKKSKEEIREEWYNNGIDIKYTTKNKDGSIKKEDIIHYEMLYRSTGAAKNGDCIFISSRLYKKAHKFLYMGLKMPKKNAPIVEASAYVSLIASSIVDRIKMNPKNILILEDVDRFFKTKVVSVEVDEDKHCVAKTINDYNVSNTLFDGQALIDSSVFPSWGNGYILLRHHMTKCAAFKTNIQDFFRDWYGDDYLTATVKDMFGNEHYVKDIELITTSNATKWLKFEVSYDYWCGRVFENNCMFGIVKTAHKSKLGDVQKMSYQMINSLDIDIMGSVTSTSREYINSLKRDDVRFLQYLKDNANFSNDYSVLVALCEQNSEFVRCEYFRARKAEIIRGYIKKFKSGKVINNGDNLIIVGSPYAMLLHSIGESVDNDDTFCVENGVIQCYTTRFDNGEYLAEFRNPFNSKNNMGYLHNVYSDKLERYFGFTDEIIAVNMIGTDAQDRNNGSDQDSDSIYVTNQPDIVKYASYCYKNYPTIVNNIPKEKNCYSNALSEYARIDTNLAEAQLAIGESSNLAQLALTYTYNFSDTKYNDYVCILSCLAQCAIDNAKRKYDIDLSSEIKKIKRDMNISENGYPKFWLNIRKDFNRKKINYNLKCPMNYLSDIKFEQFRLDQSVLPMDYFFHKFKLREDRRKSKKVEKLIEDFSLMLYTSPKEENSDYLLLRDDYEAMIETIRTTYISKEYKGLTSWLIDRAFCITPEIERGKSRLKSRISNNKSILLKALYDINSKALLEVFNK